MFCENCGTKLNEGEKFCPNCGKKNEMPLRKEDKINVGCDQVSKKKVKSKYKSNFPGQDTRATLLEKRTNVNEEKHLSEEMDEMETCNNTVGQMQRAVRLEFGLGVPVNIKKAKEFYEKAGYKCEKDLLEDCSGVNGVISSIYDVRSVVIFDRDPIAEYEKEELERKQIKISEMYKIEEKGLIKFKFYIQGYDLCEFERMVKEYNHVAFLYGYDNISFEKVYFKKVYYSLIEGVFEKGHYNIMVEKQIERVFIEICNVCESLKIK